MTFILEDEIKRETAAYLAQQKREIDAELAYQSTIGKQIPRWIKCCLSLGCRNKRHEDSSYCPYCLILQAEKARKAAICKCPVYNFPHRRFGGKCNG